MAFPQLASVEIFFFRKTHKKSTWYGQLTQRRSTRLHSQVVQQVLPLLPLADNFLLFFFSFVVLSQSLIATSRCFRHHCRCRFGPSGPHSFSRADLKTSWLKTPRQQAPKERKHLSLVSNTPKEFRATRMKKFLTNNA